MKAFGVLALLALTGCASMHREQSYHEVVSNRVFVPVADKPGADTSLIVARDSSLYGAGCSSQLLVDGQMVVQLEQGERVALPVVGGSHTLRLQSTGACMPAKQELQTAAPMGKNLGYRISADGTSISAIQS